jgi:hypothetical protein
MLQTVPGTSAAEGCCAYGCKVDVHVENTDELFELVVERSPDIAIFTMENDGPTTSRNALTGTCWRGSTVPTAKS